MVPAPSFGHRCRADFLLAHGIDHLNHGGYGATPRVVLQAAQRWRERMEADPTAFFRRDGPAGLRQAAAQVAAFLGGRADDWAFVENATAGLNAIITSLHLQPGDELLCLSQVYGAVGNALSYHAQRRGARVVTIEIPVPFTSPRPLLHGLRQAIGPRTRFACFDHITSPGAVVLPIRDMASICRQHKIPVAVDGAHAPGQIALNVPELGVDWYVGNLHKWGFAAKGTGVIWCSPERQATLHPTSISNFFGAGFTAEFDYAGTRDNSHWLAVPSAIGYLEHFGAEATRAHNDALARKAGRLLVDRWGTEAAAAPEFCAAMTAVRLPAASQGGRAEARRLMAELNDRHGITAAVMPLASALWVRISAQIYNEIGDYKRLAEIGESLAR